MVRVMMSNATFNIISVISWWSVLLLVCVYKLLFTNPNKVKVRVMVMYITFNNISVIL
jgi:hypothetical protein